jgi:DNA-binding transcriptional ArsR family regulator
MITEKDLEVLSLNPSLTKLYLAALKSGVQSAAGLAAATGLNRSNVYSLLEHLEAKNLIVVSLEGNKRRYRAGDPEIIVRLATERLAALSELLPELKALYGAGAANPKISLFEGEAALEAISAVVNAFNGDYWRYFGSLESQAAAFRWNEAHPPEKMKQPPPVARSRALRTTTTDASIFSTVDVRLGPARYFRKPVPPLAPDLFLVGPHAAFMLTTEQRGMLLINSAKIAGLLSVIWDALWDVSPTLEEVQRRSEAPDGEDAFADGI